MTSSRYTGQAVIAVPQDDGTTRPLGVPRVAPPVPPALTYQLRDGDRLDVVANAAFGDSTGWWRISDVNPFTDPLLGSEPGTVIGIPDE